jgi:hypothetical protein
MLPPPVPATAEEQVEAGGLPVLNGTVTLLNSR